ncbi:Heavy metal tolerance protein [Penicillium subrubescens]|uniref:Heavy metal tolerance protein n=1 Tax=Penicillium subrubescens TaxID=1316194 RepID=A0A1Q5TBU7_9EURO|nr:Heavy metal tolerance protein [Penicillium subrubescens]
MQNRVAGNPAFGSHRASVILTPCSSDDDPGNAAAEAPGSGDLAGYPELPFLPRAWKYVMGYKVFFLYMWPSGSRYLQVMAVVCLCLTGCQRAVNALLPYQIAVVTETLSPSSSELPCFHILKFVIYKWLQGGNGFLGSLRSTLWNEVKESSSMKLSIAAFKHVHSLDLDFHLDKRNGEILSVLRNDNPTYK